MNNSVLSVYDYVILVSLLAASLGIGVYFGFFGKGQKSARQYLYGGKSLSAIPVGLSIYSSAISAISFIGQPSEVYVFGTQLTIGSFGGFLSLIPIWGMILPIFCGNLNMSSPYEYFERRFNSKVRILAAAVYIIYAIINMPIVIYASIITFNKIFHLSSWIGISIIGGVCIFYTMFGGIKSVVWADTLQSTIMFSTLIAVSVVATKEVGTFSDVWRISKEGGRIHLFDLNPDPFVRASFWSSLIGLTVQIGSYCCTSASALQRYMSLKSESQARLSTLIGITGFVMMYVTTCVMGLAMYAYYEGCDPFKSQMVKDSNSLVLHFVMAISENIPGLIGVFVAGVFSSCLSSVSSELNITSALIYYDILTKMCGKRMKNFNDVVVMKILVLILGITAMCAVPVLYKSNYIFQLVLSTSSFCHGSRFGMLLLGILCPMANSKGAIAGGITSMLLVLWISFGALFNNVNSHYVLPTSIDKCNYNISTLVQNITSTLGDKSDSLKIYHLSFCYYTLLGTLTVIIVGVLVSYLTGKETNVEPSLVAPFLRSHVTT